MFEHLKLILKTSFVWSKVPSDWYSTNYRCTNLCPIIRGVQKVYPQIELELYEQGSKKVEISVQEGLIDIGIICTKPNPKEFESFYLTSDPLSVIIPKSSPLAKEKEIV